MKEFEQTVPTPRRSRARESELFGALRESLLPDIPVIQYNAFCVAELDAISALAATLKHSYVCPEISEDDVIDIRDGRHRWSLSPQGNRAP